MKTTLDQSHRVVLANFGIFRRAQQCVEEITSYVWDVLREIANELPVSADPSAHVAFDTKDGGWLEVRAFPNWGGTEYPLISIGIMNLKVIDLLAEDGAEECRAYVYSIPLQDAAQPAARKSLADQLRTLQPPDGFALARPNMHGYLFVKKLEAISADVLCSRPQLKNFFSTPLNELVVWLEVNKAKIASFSVPR